MTSPVKGKWLMPRLERERRKVLEAIGATSIEDARERLAEAREVRARLDAANEALTYVLADYLAPLTEPQRDCVIALGEGEPLRVIRAIKTLIPVWG